MKIQRLVLKNFRNYELSEFAFSDTVNVLIGKNAQGKTNLIEAIYLLSVAKSFRAKNTQEMIRFESEFARIVGYTECGHTKKALEMILFEKGKQARINNQLCRKTSDFVGTLNVVVFTPDDLFFVKGSPKQRRRFMDIELSKISPIYLSFFNQYQHLLKERNQYLKQAVIKNKRDPLYLEVVTKQMVACELELAKRRNDFIQRLNALAQVVYQRLSQNQEQMVLRYKTFFSSEEELLAIHQADEERDYRFTTTQHGIHKDDIAVYLDDKEASQFASQGQQRSIVLAMKIGLLQLIYQEIKEYPVLLLDDVLSELDTSRQNLLLNLVSDDIQTFITTTSIDGIHHEVIKKAKKIEIQKGRS